MVRILPPTQPTPKSTWTSAEPQGPPSGSSTDQLVDISNRLLNTIQPRMLRHPMAASFADFASCVLDTLPQDMMEDCIDEMTASLKR